MKRMVMVMAFVLSACTPMVPLQRAQVAQISAETGMGELDAMLGKATEVRRFEFIAQGKSYRVREYRLQTGSQQQTSVICTPVCVPIFVTVPVTADYVLVHEIGLQRLFAWGSLEELSKSADERVSAVMPLLKEARAKLLEGAKK